MPSSPVDTPSADQPSAARRWLAPIVIVALIAVAVVVGLVVSADAGDPEDGAGSSGGLPAADATVTVLYEVEGTTDHADVTMETPTGTSQISPDVPMVRESDGRAGLQWEFTSGDYVYLSAQNNRSHGTVSCRITVDGVVVSENSATGGYAIATCKGTA